MSRAQLKRMYLDVNFFSNPKIEALGYKFGSASQACLLEILCAMSKATNAQVDEDFIYSRIHKHRIEQASDLFNYLLEKKIIFQDGNGFSNGPVIKDQESYSRKLEASNARVTRYREKKEALPSERETRTPDTDSDYDNVSDLDLNNYELNMPGFDTAQIRHLVTELAKKFKNDGNGRVLQQQTVDSWQAEYQLKIGDFIEDAQNTLGKTKAANLIRIDRSKAPQKLSTKDFLRQEMEKENAKIRNN